MEGSPMDPTPQPIRSQKSPALVGLNFDCLLKPFN